MPQTYVGQKMICSYTFTSTDSFGDTLRITALEDRVSGTTTEDAPQTPVPMLAQVPLVFSASITGQMPTCTGGSGLGTIASPYIGATSCDIPASTNPALPLGASITGNPLDANSQPIPALGAPYFSFYTVKGSDYSLTPSHALPDQLTYHYTNLCDVSGLGGSCNNTVDNLAQAGAQTTVQQFTPAIETLLSADAIEAGASVFDTSTITLSPSSPLPPGFGGTVTYRFFPTVADCVAGTNGTQVGAVKTVTGGVIPNSDPVSFPTAGDWFFQATYSGDAANGISGPVSSDCTSEPLAVVDARISIAPQADANALGDNHVFTCRVEVNTGGGFVLAPANTLCDLDIVSGPGVFAGGDDDCTTVLATGECTVTISSTTTGISVVRACTEESAPPGQLNVGGVMLSRCTTADAGPITVANCAPSAAFGGSDAVKCWVDANISITPASATNPVGTTHTLTITVNALGGTLGAGAATASIVSGPGSFVGSPTCNYAGGAGNTCTVVITSAVAGTTVVSATASIPVSGVSIIRTTATAANTASGGSGNASKTWEGGGGEGCTPGYWKNHLSAWALTGFSPNQSLGSVFSNTGRPSTTLHAALSLGGGSSIQAAKDILLRAAVAALLNSGSVNYEFTTPQVVSMVNAALATNNRATILALATQLDDANNAGCPLGRIS